MKFSQIFLFCPQKVGENVVLKRESVTENFKVEIFAKTFSLKESVLTN